MGRWNWQVHEAFRLGKSLSNPFGHPTKQPFSELDQLHLLVSGGFQLIPSKIKVLPVKETSEGMK